MSNSESQKASIAAVSGLTEAQQQMLVEAINRARGCRFTLSRAMLPAVRFGTMAWALRYDFNKTKNPENLNLLAKIVDLGLKSAL